MKKTIDRLLGGFLVMAMALIVLAVLWQVISRYVLQSPSSLTEEIARFLLIWLGILGAAYASGQRSHLAIDILPPKLNPTNRVRLRITINLLIILFSLSVLVVGGGNLVYVNHVLGQSSAALHLPLSFVYAAVPLSGVIVIFYKTNEIIHSKRYLL